MPKPKMPNKSRRATSRKAKRGTYFSVKSNQVIHYRSSWELAYAKYLDDELLVCSYKYEPYYIEYVSNVRTGKVRKYWPDFEVTMKDGTKLLVEIKPAKKAIQMKNIKKAYYAKQFALSNNMKYVVVTENELRALGLI